MTFLDVVSECAAHRPFVDNIDRLTGNRFGEVFRSTGINRMIDESTGHLQGELWRFAAYVFDLVWCRMEPTEVKT